MGFIRWKHIDRVVIFHWLSQISSTWFLVFNVENTNGKNLHESGLPSTKPITPLPIRVRENSFHS